MTSNPIRKLHRTLPFPGELYGSAALRMAAINGLSVGRLLGAVGPVFRDCSRVRDQGEACSRYAMLFPEVPDMVYQVRRTGTLLGYYLGDRLCRDISRPPVIRSFPRRGASLHLCPECYFKDFDSHGVGIWHIEHQLPLTYACRRHRCLLIDVPMHVAMQLPTDAALRNSSISSRALSPLLALADVESFVWAARLKAYAYSRLVTLTRSRLPEVSAGALAALVRATLGAIVDIGLIDLACREWYLEQECEVFLEGPVPDVDPMTTTLLLVTSHALGADAGN